MKGEREGRGGRRGCAARDRGDRKGRGGKRGWELRGSLQDEDKEDTEDVLRVVNHVILLIISY